MNSINSNAMTADVASNVSSHYGRLKTSAQRLSSGLRINSSADDAAGMAIREMMRADVAAINQGVRNANDAISMLQVADGALAIIDEKLIRMKELAEQAATGTYDSTQRLMIDSEFQAMGAEIDRIANATDFNGIHLLDGSLKGTHDGSGLESTGAMKIHFGTANDSAEDYYYVEVDDCTTAGLGLGNKLVLKENAPPGVQWITEAKIDTVGRHIILDIPSAYAGQNNAAFAKGLDYYSLPVGLENITITSNAVDRHPYHKPHVCLFENLGGTNIRQITGMPLVSTSDFSVTVSTNGAKAIVPAKELKNWWNGITPEAFVKLGADAGLFDPNAQVVSTARLMDKDRVITMSGGAVLHQVSGQNEAGSWWNKIARLDSPTEEIIELDKVTSNLVFFIGGHENPGDGCNHYRLRIEADVTEEFLQKLQTWSGEAVLDEYYGDMVDIKTQEKAQKALTRIDDAIVKKDQVRAHIGALQNRFENTVTNLTIQGENLQAAESRISDVDVAREMTEFVRNQVLSQSAVAMLGQANSYPHMLAGLLQG